MPDILMDLVQGTSCGRPTASARTPARTRGAGASLALVVRPVVALLLPLVASTAACDGPAQPTADTAAARAAQELVQARLLGGYIPDPAAAATWARVSATQRQVRAMLSAAGVHLAEHPGACPAVRDLLAEGLLNPSAGERDAWGQPFTLECAAEAARVCSSGPDGRPHSFDDVCLPRLPLQS